jgi:hypothetical protein
VRTLQADLQNGMRATASRAAEKLKKSSFRGMPFAEESLFSWV